MHTQSYIIIKHVAQLDFSFPIPFQQNAKLKPYLLVIYVNNLRSMRGSGYQSRMRRD